MLLGQLPVEVHGEVTVGRDGLIDQDGIWFGRPRLGGVCVSAAQDSAQYDRAGKQKNVSEA